MKNILVNTFTALALLLAVSCSDESTLSSSFDTDGGETMTVSATAGTISRTILNEDLSVSWCKGDNITLFNSTGNALLFLSDLADDYATTADFDGPIVDKTGELYAMYPYNSSYAADYTEQTITFTMPATRYYNEGGGFGSGANQSVAVSSSKDFTFNNLCGALELPLKGDKFVSSITVTSQDENLNGTTTVDMTTQSISAIAGEEESNKSVTLNCSEGVQLVVGEDTTFFILLPPTSGALDVTIYFGDNTYETYTTTSGITEGEIMKMPSISCLEAVIETAKITNKPGTMDSDEVYNIFAIGNTYTMEWAYTTGSTETMTWKSDAEGVATVGETSGIISFLAAGDVKISLLAEGEEVDYVELVVDAGYIRDEYNDGDSNYTILPLSSVSNQYSDASYDASGGVLTTTLALHTSGNGYYRVTYQASSGLSVDFETYPIIAFKMEYMRYMYDSGNNSYTKKIAISARHLDSSSTASTASYTIDTPTELLSKSGKENSYYLFQANLVDNLMYSSETTNNLFEFKLADVQSSNGVPTYEIDWIRSFKNSDDLATFLSRTGDQ